MADADTTKKRRTAAKSKFTRIENNITKSIKKDKNVDALSILYDDINSCWQHLDEMHSQYISYREEGIAEDEAWINEMEESYFKIRLEVIEYKRKNENKIAVVHMENKLKISEENIDRLCTALESSIKKKDQIETVIRNQNEIIQTFEEFKKYNSELCELTTDGKAMKITALKSSEILRLNQLVDRYIIDLQSNQQIQMQIEKMPPLKLNGDIRTDPRFRKDFEELVLPQVPPAQASFTLRQCLTPEVESHLSLCEDDINVMLARLVERYGDVGRLVKTVVSEIRMF